MTLIRAHIFVNG